MWLVAGIMMLVSFRRLNPVIVPVGIYFLFLSVWWFANELMPVYLMHGAYGWIFRGISAAAVILCVVIYLASRKNGGDDNEKDGNKQ